MTLEELTRERDRRRRDRVELDRLVDEVLVATVATVTEDGRPWVVPMLVARDGDRLLLHGSTGAGALRRIAAGAETAVEMHVVDGLVLASTTFDSSANYRSAVVRGTLQRLTGNDAVRALDALSEGVLPGRTTEVRAMLPKEVAATVVLAMEIGDDNWILKARTGGTEEDPADVPDDVWTGVLPMHTAYGEPEPAPWSAGLPVPDSIHRRTGRVGGTA